MTTPVLVSVDAAKRLAVGADRDRRMGAGDPSHLGAGGDVDHGGAVGSGDQDLGRVGRERDVALEVGRCEAVLDDRLAAALDVPHERDGGELSGT